VKKGGVVIECGILDIAWILRTDSRKRRVGFVQARELTPGERYVLPEE
jgi:hypothetical protein